jgi:hypothetical protein
VLATFVKGRLTDTSPSQTGTLYVGASQLFSFSLSAGLDDAPPGVVVQMSITDASGQVVFSLNAAGEEDHRAAAAVFLDPGAYSVEVSVVSPSGPLTDSVGFHLSGTVLSDPVGPKVYDPTIDSQYQVPDQPGAYLYPNCITTTDPYYWVGFVF